MRFYPTGGSGGASGSEECTATREDLLKGTTAILSDSDDEPVEGLLELTGDANTDDVLSGCTFYNSNAKQRETGTLALTGNAQAAHVLVGETFYTTDAKQKQTGTLSVNSILSFSVAAYSGRRVLLKWQNPYAAPGKPYCGVVIKADTGTYPAWNTPTWAAVYSGVGNNTEPGGWSQVYMDLPALNTTYYFTAQSYANANLPGEDGTLYSPVYDPSSVKYATCTTAAPSIVQITYTQNYTVPVGFTSADIFCVGAGGGGGCGYRYTDNAYEQGGGGGGSGRTVTVNGVGVSEGQVLSCQIGAGGVSSGGISYTGTTGGSTTVSRGGVVLCAANGGNGGYDAYSAEGGSGGSAGGDGGYNDLDGVIQSPENGFSDGSGFTTSNTGQGYTTRAFGEASGTLYAGGGAGGGVSGAALAYGGAGGGGNGGSYNGGGGNGQANTGGGGGGGGGGSYGTVRNGGVGGSGIILIRLK